MPEARLDLTADLGRLKSELDQYKKELQDLRGEVEQYRTQSNAAFNGAGKGVDNATKKINEQTKALNKNEKEVKDLKNEQRKLEKQSKKTYNTKDIKKYGKEVGGLGKILKGAGLVVLFQQGLQALRSFIVGGINAYQTQVQAVAKVRQAIESTGGAAGRSLEELTDQASEFQKNTLFGDEQILNGVTAQLLTFTNIAGEQFDRTQSVALDLATVLDGDLQSASIQLGKALNDPVANLTALSRAGIQFSKDQQAVIKQLAQTNRLSEAQSLILDELERQYGGQAEAAAIANGGFKQTSNIIGDLQEAIGGRLVGSLQDYNTSVQEAALRTIDWVENSAAADILFAAFKATIDGVIDVFRDYSKNLDRISASFNGLLETLGIFQEEGEKSSAVITGINLALAASAVPFKVLIGSIDAIIQGFKALFEGGKLVVDFFSNGFQLTQGTEALDNALNDFQNSIVDTATGIVSPFAEALFGEGETVEEEAKEKGKKTAQIYGKAVRDQLDVETAKEIKAREAAQKKFLDAMVKIEGEAEAARIAGLTGEDRIQAEAEVAQRRIDQLEATLREELNALGLSGDARLAEEKRISDAIALVRKQAEDETQKELRQFRIDKANENIELNQQIAEQQAEAERIQAVKNGESLEDAERKKQERILQIQIEFARKRLALIKGKEGAEFDLQRQQLNNFINDAELQIEGLRSSGEGRKPIFQTLLGATDEEFAAISASVTELAGTVVSALQDNLNAQISSNQTFIDNLNQRYDELSANLEREEELRAKGLANNVDGERDALNQVKLEREKALAEQQRLQRRQAQLDALTQTSSLITAGAKIFAAESGKGLLGVALGISAIATLLSFFGRLKNQANAATQLRDGGFGDKYGVVTGKRHAQGGEDFNDHVELEEGEAYSVFNRPTTKKYRKALGDFTAKMNSGNVEGAIQDLIAGTGVKLRSDAPERAFDIANGFSGRSTKSRSQGSLMAIERRLMAMEELLEQWPKEFMDLKTGRKYTKQGNTRIFEKID